MPLPPRKKYEGRSRRLLLAFDIGTTFSGISYSILDPGNVPEIRPVTRFPFQEHVGGDSKIPTVIFYDKGGKICAIGAQTLTEGIEEDVIDNNWSQARWFKLHLRPKKSSGSSLDDDLLPPLPPNKSLEQVFSDYMKYLHECAEAYITEVHGKCVWSSVQTDILYVLTHPNGWGGPEQAKMRRYAITAGFVPNADEGLPSISFVTEGEASLHFCLSNGLELDGDDHSNAVMIVDAGGGTIDVTTYRRTSRVAFEEVVIPQCYFQGAVYVARRAKRHFEDLLKGSRFFQDVDVLTRHFDRRTKHVFRKDTEPHHIQFGSHRDRDPALNIRGGRLTIKGTDVAEFFKPSIDCIVEAILDQKSYSKYPVKTAFLVGGFSASTWLYESVRRRVERFGIALCRPDSHVNKAVSNGAVSFHLDHVVTTRVARVTYGMHCKLPFDPSLRSHRLRRSEAVISPFTGNSRIDGAFDVILHKNTRVTETTEFRRSYYRESSSPQCLKDISSNILFYGGSSPQCPAWVSDAPDSFHTACTVEATLEPSALQKTWSTVQWSMYHEAHYDIILLLGMTEVKAQIAWKHNGIEKRGPASVVYSQ